MFKGKKLIGIPVILLMLVMVFTGCDDGGGNYSTVSHIGTPPLNQAPLFPVGVDMVDNLEEAVALWTQLEQRMATIIGPYLASASNEAFLSAFAVENALRPQAGATILMHVDRLIRDDAGVLLPVGDIPDRIQFRTRNFTDISLLNVLSIGSTIRGNDNHVFTFTTGPKTAALAAPNNRLNITALDWRPFSAIYIATGTNFNDSASATNQLFVGTPSEGDGFRVRSTISRRFTIPILTDLNDFFGYCIYCGPGSGQHTCQVVTVTTPSEMFGGQIRVELSEDVTYIYDEDTGLWNVPTGRSRSTAQMSAAITFVSAAYMSTPTEAGRIGARFVFQMARDSELNRRRFDNTTRAVDTVTSSRISNVRVYDGTPGGTANTTPNATYTIPGYIVQDIAGGGGSAGFIIRAATGTDLASPGDERERSGFPAFLDLAGAVNTFDVMYKNPHYWIATPTNLR